MKDYYKILELTPEATPAEIKKSFRRLALLYHPDRNQGSNVYEAKFKEIKEAYEILSSGRQRQEYNRERTKKPPPEKKEPYRQATPQTILNQVTELSKKTSLLDPDRMNTFALYNRMQQVLVIQNVLILKHANDVNINKSIINQLLYCAQFLPFHLAEKICVLLLQIANTDNESYRNIHQFTKNARFRGFWKKYMFAFALVVTLILCLLMYALGQGFRRA